MKLPESPETSESTSGVERNQPLLLLPNDSKDVEIKCNGLDSLCSKEESELIINKMDK